MRSSWKRSRKTSAFSFTVSRSVMMQGNPALILRFPSILRNPGGSAQGKKLSFAGINHIEPRTSSVSEILVKLLDADKIDTECAAAFYTGIVHDTGVFRYDSVTGDTLRTAAVLVDKGIPFSEIIEHSISNLSYREMLIASEVILGSHFYEEEKLLTGFAPLSLQQKIGISPLEFGSVVTELNQMDRAETVLFLYETEPGVYKGSLRSKGPVSVSGIAALFGGGGHERAAGFSLAEPPEVIIEKVRAAVSEARKS